MRFLVTTSVLVFSFLFTLLLPLSAISSIQRPGKIIGDDDLIAVNNDVSNIPAKYKKIVDAFGLMSNGCTATHIGNGYAITAGHCFWAKSIVQEGVDCEGITVRWGLRLGASANLKSNCEHVVSMFRNDSNDFAIIKVSPEPDVAIEMELNRKAQLHDVITVFSHPTNMSLRWSRTCTVESSEGVTMYKDFLLHKCDTNPGSSGATILDANTNKIVGVHSGGRVTSPGVGINYGTFLTNIEILTELRKIGF